MDQRVRTRYGKLFLVSFLFFPLLVPGVTLGQISNEARREMVRLERLAENVWEGLLEEHRFGSPVDQGTKLDVFNFLNGARALRENMESSRTRASELADVLELLLLQSDAVNRSLRNIKIGRLILREWGDTKVSLNSLARLLSPSKGIPSRPMETRGSPENINGLGIEISEIRAVGNIFKNDHRIRGIISGRNIVSAGIYAKGQLVKSISVPLHDRNKRETTFSFRMKAQEGITVRVIDSQGLLIERTVKFPSRGGFPGLR